MMNTVDSLRTLSSRELYALGIQDVAYVKKVREDGVEAFAVHAADGTRLGLLPTRDIAVSALLEHDLEPVALH